MTNDAVNPEDQKPRSNRKWLLGGFALLLVVVVVVLAVAIPLSRHNKGNSSVSFNNSQEDTLSSPSPSSATIKPSQTPFGSQSKEPTASPAFLASPIRNFQNSESPHKEDSIASWLMPTSLATHASQSPSNKGTTTNSSGESDTTSDSSSAPSTEPEIVPGTIVMGTTANSVDYYHCAASEPLHHLVLMHGASFSKENWKETGMLNAWCDNPRVSVTALDQSPGFGAMWLQETLNNLVEEISLELPVVMITPSASGWVMADWMTGGASLDDLLNFVEVWIPIATPSLSRASHDQVRVFGEVMKRILAVYGNEDEGGMRLSQRLERFANATVMELPGGHPVYLQVPKQFVEVVNNYLGV